MLLISSSQVSFAPSIGEARVSASFCFSASLFLRLSSNVRASPFRRGDASPSWRSILAALYHWIWLVEAFVFRIEPDRPVIC